MKKIIEYFQDLGVDASTTATILVTVIIFGLGLLISLFGKYISARNNRRIYRNTILELLKNFQNDCFKQEKVLNDSLSKVGLANGKDFIINYINISTLEYLNKLDFSEFLKNFRSNQCNKKIYSKSISKLFSIITNLKVMNDRAPTLLNRFMESFSNHEKDYKNSLSEIKYMCDELYITVKDTKPDGSPKSLFLNQFFPIFNYLASTEAKFDPSSTHTNIILPIIEIVRQYEDSLTLKISQAALKCDFAFRNIQRIDELLIEEFWRFANAHRRARRLLGIIIKILK